MVLAIVALLLQASPAPQSVPGNFPVPTVAIGTSPDASSTPRPTEATAPAASPMPPEATPKTTEDDTAVVKLDLKSVKLDAGESKTTRTYSLNAVSLDTAQNSPSFSTIRIPDPKAPKQIGITSAEAYPSHRAWVALSVVQHSAAFFDAYSTRQAISKGAVEDDPMMRPFASSPAIYGAIQAGPVLLDFVSRRMQHSEFSLVRRMWWVPQTMSTGAYLFSGAHNLGVSRRLH